MAAKTLMIQGTASSVGKSLLAAALCRILRQDGLRVAPFKAQNMALNSFATRAGGEMGRAQVVQARAAGVEPSVDMNPILLKPEADHRSQVVVLGRVRGSMGFRDYRALHHELLGVVEGALQRLRAAYDVVVIEGAGSPAEINLRAGEIVNMRIARLAGAPVLLVGDIDRGGVFAHLVGTLELLEPAERALVKGFLINKFRGDVSLLQPGLDVLARRTGVPVLGVVPYLADVRLPEEDSVALEGPHRPTPPSTPVEKGSAGRDRGRGGGAVAARRELRRFRSAGARAGGGRAVRQRGGRGGRTGPARGAGYEDDGGRPALAAGARAGGGDGGPRAAGHSGHRHLRRLPDARPGHRGPAGRRERAGR
jgi:dethiobiotin synthetase